MKKAWFTVLLLLLVSNVFAGERIDISSGKIIISDPLIGNWNNTDYKITFDPESNHYFLVFDAADPQFIIELTEEHLKQLMRIMDKYREWEDVAIKNQVTIDKPIPDGIVITTVHWLYRGKWYFAKDFHLKAQFVSKDKQTHHLKFYAGKVWSPNNQNIGFEMKHLYFNRDMAAAFNQGILPESIKKAKDDYKKQQEAGSLFN